MIGWLDELAEQLARALGVFGFDATRLSVVRDDTGWSVQPRGETCRSLPDAPTVIILLLGWARDLVVDVGPCPFCLPTKGISAFETRDGARLWLRRRRKELRGCKPVRFPEGGWGLWSNERADWASYSDVTPRCSSCTIDGQPTGRHVVAWERAVLDATTRPCANKHCDDGVDTDPGDPPVLCDDCSGEGKQNGDRATRDALAVQADQRQASWCCPASCGCCHGTGYETEGTSTGLPRWKTETLARMYPVSDGWVLREAASSWRATRTCPFTRDERRFGEFVTAWLRGPCERCDARGRVSGLTGQSTVLDPGLRPHDTRLCPDCSGTGHVLGAFEPELRHAIEAEIEARAA